MATDWLNTLAMVNVYLDIHPALEDVLCKFIALGPNMLDFDNYYQFYVYLIKFVLFLLVKLYMYILL